jgi:hypothetical protein
MSYTGTTPKFDSVEGDNIKVDGNTISSTNTNGNILVVPNGTGKVGVGTASPNASAALDVTSTIGGFLPPRMTTAQRDAIASPATGLIIKNTTINALQEYNGVSWETLNNTYVPKVLPSLNLDFTSSDTLDPRIDFSRNSIASKTNFKGLIELVDANVPRRDFDPNTGEVKGLLIEEARTNLLSYSENFDNSYWSQQFCTILANSAIAPDGTLTADTIVDEASNNPHRVLRTLTKANSPVTYSFSCFVKLASTSTKQHIQMQANANTSLHRVFLQYDVTTNIFSSPTVEGDYSYINATSQILSNGWVRLSLSFVTGSQTQVSVMVAPSEPTSSVYLGTGIPQLIIWGAQLEVGSFPTSYIPSNNTFTSRASSASFIDADGLVKYAGNNVARQNYLPTDLSLAPKLLLEESRTNLLQYSQEFDNVYWNKGGCSVFPSYQSAPDGTLTSILFIPDTTSIVHSIFRTVTTVAGSSLTFSMYVKNAGYDNFLLYFDGLGEGRIGALFNLTTKTVITNVSLNTATGAEGSYGLEELKDGWFRAWITTNGVATDTSTIPVIRWTDNLPAYNAISGNGTSGLFIWGAQLEVGAYPTSYIQSSLSFTSRSSIGSYVDSDGLVKIAANNEARNNYTPSNLSLAPRLLLEESRTNTYQYTENFNDSYWTKTRSYIQADVEIAPDGSRTADKLVEDTAAANNHYVTREASYFSAGFVQTISAFVKAGERTNVFLGFFGDAFGGVTIGKYFNLLTGTVGAGEGINPQIVQYPNGWYRVSVTAATTAAATGSSAIYLATGTGSGNINYTGDGRSGIFIWGAQLEVGAYPTSYIPSSQTFTSRASTGTFIGSDGLIQSAAIDVARQQYNPLSLALPPKLLLEESRTNLLQYSQEFDNSYWSKINATINANVEVAPDGALTADQIVDDAVNTGHQLLRVITKAASPTTYTASIFVKKTPGGKDFVQYFIADSAAAGTNRSLVHFNMVTETFGNFVQQGTFTNGSYGYQKFPNGWFRVWITATTGTETGLRFNVAPAEAATSGYIGNGIDGLFIWGAQLEVGAYPTSYIPTVDSSVTRSADVSTSASVTRAADVSTSAAVTRAADVSSSAARTRQADLASMTGENFSSWYRQDEGTVVTSSYIAISGTQIAGGGNRIWELRNSETLDENRIAHFLATPSAIGTSMNTFNSAQLSSISGAYGLNTKTISAVGVARNNFIQGTNGSLSLLDSSAIIPTVNQFLIGISRTGSQSINGHIANITYYPKRLSNAELQAISR